MSPRAQGFLVALVMLLVMATAWRVVFWSSFRSAAYTLPTATLAEAFYLGFKFDLRLILLALSPLVTLGLWAKLDPTRNPRARRFWIFHLTLLATVLTLVYVVDFANYGYLHERIDVSILRYLRNPLISFGMTWESYPVVWAALGLVAFAALFGILLARWTPAADPNRPAPPSGWRRRLGVTLAVVLYVALIYGKASYYPLRWSDAFFTNRQFVSDIALNPTLFFLNTLRTSEDEAEFDLPALASSYDAVARFVGAESPDAATFSLARYVHPNPLGPRPLNVVLIFLESFAAYSTGTFGNPMEASPKFDALAEQGLLFSRFYSPRRGTARGVFATLTGIPDTMTFRTASRNPRSMSQETVLRAFEGYDKYYFLGGSASWANIRALFSRNLQDVILFEEGSYTSARDDAWGISDYHLFEEANRELSRQHAEAGPPFFAFIHLSGNHRPYTIPDDIEGFELVDRDPDELLAYGFESPAQYNSFRLLDYSLGHFFDLARQEAYFGDTLFVILSDNGEVASGPHVPASVPALRLGAHHTPLLFYSPRLGDLQPGVVDIPASQVDVLPTIAGLAGIPALNTTLGRNLFDPRFADRHFAFLYRTRGSQGEIVLAGPDSTLLMNLDGTNVRLHPFPSDDPFVDTSADDPERTLALKEIGLGMYHASKYLLYNNSPARYEAEGLALRSDGGDE